MGVSSARMAARPSLRGVAAIAGVADIVSPTGRLEGTLPALEARAVREALDDAGLGLRDVDGVFVARREPMASLDFAERLGIRPRWTDTTMTGGSSFEVHVEHAAAAIAAGLCEVAVVVYASTPLAPGSYRPGQRQHEWNAARPSPVSEWEAPYGLPLPMGAYALAATRHMALFGTTSEDLAEIAVSTRRWASMNPRAKLRDLVTVDDVLSSPLVCSPLHKLDCCLVTDGAGALVVTSTERARSLARPVVPVLGVGTAHAHHVIGAMEDLTRTPGADSGPAAFAMAGISPADVDVLETYDSFTITVLLSLEDLGFCAKGEGGAFVRGHRLGPGGDLPTNTNGGGLAYAHPGMYGIFLLVEAVRQLRGECGERQVERPEIAVAHGTGGYLSCTSTVVLGTEATL